ncbi:MAG: competence/damage-inducible protein A [Deltaproteobacteria bacterium]|nr:competence/damage-inducible protein A [Deltaproteobacteria bacterium]
MMSTAAALIIGDEILSGKVEERNLAALIAVLRERGVVLRRVVFVRDDPAEIAADVRALAEQHDYLFTSGGVGPTHDDRTIGAIADAFGVPVLRHPRLVTLLKEHLGDRANDAALRMADVPEGTELCGDGPYPLIKFRNVYILPGVPQIFAAKINALAPSLIGKRRALARVFLRVPESVVAERLGQLERDFDVTVGSYPFLDRSDYSLMVTIEADCAQEATRAQQTLLNRLESRHVVGHEPPADA